jgi:hypothetical protein
MKLASVVKGRLAKPLRVLVYGVEGVGKSTFAASAPSPIFLGAEDGTSELDVPRFPEPHSWKDVLDAVDELTEAEHDYKTLAIDTLDWMEPICWAHVCATKKDKNGKSFQSIEDLGYGKGYTAALEHWRLLLSKLERLRAKRGMTIIPIAHSWIKTFKNPTGDDFDRYQLKLHEKASAIWREWCDVVLFAAHETLTYETNGRAKGVQGARVLYTERCAAWEAKNRQDLPPKLPLDWDAFAEAVAAHRPADPAKLRARIEELLPLVGEDIQTRVKTALEKAGDDAAQLAKIENKLAAMASEAEAQPMEETQS